MKINFDQVQTKTAQELEQQRLDNQKEAQELVSQLQKTDWMVVRKQTTGWEIPANVVTKREAAYARLTELEIQGIEYEH